MRLSLLELPHRFGDAQGQLQLVDDLLSRRETDLALLPEAGLTGYVSPDFNFDLSAFAEVTSGPTTQALSQLAKKHACYLVGPLIERAGADFFNSCVGFTPDGALWLHYQKRHPWFVETWARPGSNLLPLVKALGFTFAVAICFDVHFLAAESAEQLKQADVLLFPSAWTEEGADSRPQLFQRLSEEFGLSIANANWGVGIPGVAGQGDSMLWTPSGCQRELTCFESTPGFKRKACRRDWILERQSHLSEQPVQVPIRQS
jgi:5-aminopentanamidase